MQRHWLEFLLHCQEGAGNDAAAVIAGGVAGEVLRRDGASEVDARVVAVQVVADRWPCARRRQGGGGAYLVRLGLRCGGGVGSVIMLGLGLEGGGGGKFASGVTTLRNK